MKGKIKIGTCEEFFWTFLFICFLFQYKYFFDNLFAMLSIIFDTTNFNIFPVKNREKKQRNLDSREEET